MADIVAERAHPLSGKVFAGVGVAVTPAPQTESYRCSLRVAAGEVAKLSKVIGIELPTKPKTSVTDRTRTAMWLGPDEWLIIDTKNDPNAELARSNVLHSAVDVTHRNTALQVSGPFAADVINAGCPQDLSLETFPVGACSRTILGKAEVVLLRVKPTVFRIEVWRSFSAYAFEFLTVSARDAG